jgi:hypothetical protein
MPMSDHLFGLLYQAANRVPWVAHFSDPWTDNPFRRHAGAELAQERAVMAAADALVFTSPETLELVMHKYDAGIRAKARVIPHSHPVQASEPAEPGYVIRSVGSFYGDRSPKPLYEAVERLAREAPGLLADVRIELAGPLGEHQGLLDAYPAAGQVIRLFGSVDFATGQALMRRASCQLLVDAPAALSVFFPSKLAEYLGTGRYIFAITPPGTSARIVGEVGGTVVDPRDGDGIVAGLRALLEARPDRLPRPTHAYEEAEVARAANALLADVRGR